MVDREVYLEGTWVPAGDHRVWALIFDTRKRYFGNACQPASTAGATWQSARLNAGGADDSYRGRTYYAEAWVLDSADSTTLRRACVASQGHGVDLGELDLSHVDVVRVALVRK